VRDGIGGQVLEELEGERLGEGGVVGPELACWTLRVQNGPWAMGAAILALSDVTVYVREGSVLPLPLRGT
jgi:hypothetical protein